MCTLTTGGVNNAFNHYASKFTMSKKENKIREYICEEIHTVLICSLPTGVSHYPYHQVVLLDICDIYVYI